MIKYKSQVQTQIVNLDIRRLLYFIFSLTFFSFSQAQQFAVELSEMTRVFY